jgi:hypothetical protein
MLVGLDETQTLGPSYIAEFDSDITKGEVKEFILKIKNSNAQPSSGRYFEP